jgi:hypothetical protein
MNREASGPRPQTSGKEEKDFRLQASGKAEEEEEEQRGFRP